MWFLPWTGCLLETTSFHIIRHDHWIELNLQNSHYSFEPKILWHGAKSFFDLSQYRVYIDSSPLNNNPYTVVYKNSFKFSTELNLHVVQRMFELGI